LASFLLYLVLVPLTGSILSYALSLKSKKLGSLIATGSAFLCAGIATYLFKNLPDGADSEFRITLWEWFAIYGEPINIEFAYDRLTAVMCLVITWVGSLIHLYSVGYMSDDESQGRFFAYLNLFLFSMLVLVLGASLPLVFIGWEGVGLCSYLLIGFWFTNPEYAKAGQKAFVVNRIGDIGFVLGMLFLARQGLSLTFTDLRAEVGGIPPEILSIAAICLFLGAAGKSAQLPLFTWLPDAMAGPTPVSALIHAATMVTAGVYLFARMDFLLVGAPGAQILIIVAGALTAFIGGTSALVQRDIKKVLAYSTVSQLGFMFMAVGAGALSAAIFHVVTHAFFKAVLFLSAGSVIHGCHHEQNLDKFGGLWKKMPVTFVCYLVGTLAIAGVPYFSGAFSKDLILERTYEFQGPQAFFWLGRFAWALGVLTAGITAFYMFRSLILTFFGSYRGKSEPHESGPLLLLPIVLLAIPSAAFGALYGEPLLHYLASWEGMHIELPDADAHFLEQVVLAFSASGILLSFIVYLLLPSSRIALGKLLPNLKIFLGKAWVFDDLYAFLILAPISFFARFLTGFIDRGIINGSMSAVGTVTEATGELLRRSHTGRIPQFVGAMLSSLVLFIIFLFLIK